MLYKLGDHVFDPEKCVFYYSNLTEEQLKRLDSAIPDRFSSDVNDEQCAVCELPKAPPKKATPYEGGIILTYKCQLRCNYCSYESTDSSEKSLSVSDVKTFVRYLLKNRLLRNLMSDNGNSVEELSLTFSGGGEPTYDAEFFKEAVLAAEEVCKENNVKLSLNLTTNGMNGGLVEFIAEHFDSVMISFDGIEAIQNKNRPISGGRGSFQTVSENIKRYCSLSDKIKIIIRTTLWQSDYRHLYEIADHIAESYPQIVNWSVSPMHAGGRGGKNSSSSDFMISDETDFSRIYFDMKKYLREKKVSFRFTSPMFWANEVGAYCGQLYLPAAWLFPGGEISTCLDSYKFSPIIGTIKDGRIQKNDDCRNLLAEKYLQKYDECRSCLVYPFCNGGCPLRFLYDSDSAEAGHLSECNSRISYWKYIFSRIILGETVEGLYLEDDEELSEFGVKRIRKRG